MTFQIRVGDCLDVLKTLDAASVQTCVTSPPYFGLRDYGVAGQIGLESTPDAFVAKLVAVFAEVRRVLKDDGTLWLNLGDSYATNVHTGSYGKNAEYQSLNSISGSRIPPGFKPKDLIGIPWRVAFALQADGWYLRSDIIWHKPNPMPESVTDRPTKAHEYLFLLAKSERYYYDSEAIKEDFAESTIAAHGGRPSVPQRAEAAYSDAAGNGRRNGKGASTLTNGAARLEAGQRNRRTVWTVATQPYSGAHFATFPPALIEPCILAGTSPQACEHCGAPWQRVLDRSERVRVREGSDTSGGAAIEAAKGSHGEKSIFWTGEKPIIKTVGWEPTCDCENNTGAGRCVVLDPFGGAGTTGLVADRLGRNALLIELNPAYAQLARNRITDDAPLFADGAA